MKKELFMFDTTIAKVFKELKINSLLRNANIQKRCGISVDKVVYDLFHIPFLMLTTVFLFVRNQFEEAVSKNVFYRFLENANYNWHLFVLNLSCQVDKNMESKSCPATEKFFVLDDTITEVTGKLIECASYIYDHTIRKSVLGFQKLVLGIYTSDRFIPISQRICVGKKRPNKKSKARKYTKIPKSDKIHPESAGAKEREELDKNKLEKSYSLLKEAKKKIKDVNYVLCILVPKVFGMVFLWHFLFLLLFRPNSNMLFLFGLSGAFSIAQIRKSSWRREPRISNRFSIINRK